MEIPGVDVVVGTQDRHKLLGYIDEFRKDANQLMVLEISSKI